jgi:hypothetical protein
MIEERRVIGGVARTIWLAGAVGSIPIASRTVQGAGAETFADDASGRLIAHINDLGGFTLA